MHQGDTSFLNFSWSAVGNLVH